MSCKYCNRKDNLCYEDTEACDDYEEKSNV